MGYVGGDCQLGGTKECDYGSEFSRFGRELPAFYGWFFYDCTFLLRLTRKEVKFVWDERCEKIFQTLKDRLAFVPIFTSPTSWKKFVVFSDTSHQGLGCVI